MRLIYILIALGITLLTSCTQSTSISEEIKAASTINQSNQHTGTATLIINPSSQPTETIVPSLTSTLTLTGTPTLTPSTTSTLTPVSTPTFTSSPTPNMVMPGLYNGGGCSSVTLRYNIQEKFCVINVNVTRDRHMIFTVSWTLTNIPDAITVTKRSDQNNTSMYLIDNLGNQYNHIAGGGSAYVSEKVSNDTTMIGWFEFKAPPEGARSFTFYEEDNGNVISGISLSTPLILFKEYTLENYPLVLEYRIEIWDSVQADDGNNVLTHKKISDCTLQASSNSQPQGTLKNVTDIGNVTYEIYGYIEQDKSLGIREYIAVNGLEGMQTGMNPLFLVTIPLDDSLPCILDVSELLATLALQEP